MEQIIQGKRTQILEIYNQYKEFNTDFIYQKDLEILLKQISQKCIPLNVINILQKMQAKSKQKLNFEEFIDLMYQQDSQDINVIQKENENEKHSQLKVNHEEKQDQIQKSSQSIKDQLQQNSQHIEKLLNQPDQSKVKSPTPSQSNLENDKRLSPDLSISRQLSVQNSQKSLHKKQQEQESRNTPRIPSRISQSSSKKDLQSNEQEQKANDNNQISINEKNDKNQHDNQKENKKQEDSKLSRDNLHSDQANNTNIEKEIQNQQLDKEFSEGDQIQNQELNELEVQRRSSSLDNSIKNQDKNVNKEENNQDIMNKGSQNFFNPKKNSNSNEESGEDINQERFDGIRFSQEDYQDQNVNNFFSPNHSSVIDNSQEISEDQIQEYKQLLQKNQYPNHQNNCFVLQEYQLFYKDYIDEVFQKFSQPVDEDDEQQQQEDSQDQSKYQNGQNKLVKVNSFSSVMMDLFKDKIWILTHKSDREEFHSKTNGYRKLFQAIDNYFIKIKEMDPTTFKLTEATFDKDEFFKILEYWSSCEPQLYFSQEAPKYQNIDEQDELNYKSSMSLVSQVAQIRNNNSNVSQDEILSARREQKLIQELKKTIEKYKKMMVEAETEVERKALNTIIIDLENQLNQYIQQNPHEISLLNNNKAQGNKKNQENNPKQESYIEILDHSKSKSPSKKSLNLIGPPMTKEEKRDKHLQIIYKFYCKQSYVSGKYATFDRVQYESNNMSMGKFFLFVRDFGIVNKNLKKNKLVEVFKKNSANSKDITFEEFKYILQKISEIHVEEQKQNNNSDQSRKEVPSSIVVKTQESIDKKSISPLIKKQNSVDRFLQLEGEELDEFISQQPNKANPKLIENKNEKLEKFYNFLCIDDQNKIKDKVKSPNLPFHTHAKAEQNVVNYKFNPQKYQDKQSEEIKELLKQRKESKEKERATLAKKYSEEKELPQVSLTKKFSKNAQKKIQNEQEQIYGPTECTWDSLLGNNYSQLRFLNQLEFKPTDLFFENTPEDDEYLEHYKIDYQNQQQQQQKEELLKKIENYGEIKPKKLVSRQKSTIETNINGQNLQLLEQPIQSYDNSPQQIRTNKIFIKREQSGQQRGQSQPLNSIIQGQPQKIAQSQSKINNDKYIKIDHQNESGVKSQRSISGYEINNNLYGQKNHLKEQLSIHSELQPQHSTNSVNVYDIQPQYSYFQTPEKKIKLRESRSLQKSQHTDSSFNKSRGNISLLKNNKDLNNSSVGDLIDFFNPITDRQKNIVQNQRQRISQIENASRKKEKEMIDNLINNSSNSQNLLTKKISHQNSLRQNNFTSSKKNSYIQ